MKVVLVILALVASNAFGSVTPNEVIPLSYVGEDAEHIYGQMDSGLAVALPINPEAAGHYRELAKSKCYRSTIDREAVGDTFCFKGSEKIAMSDEEFYHKYSVTPKQAKQRVEQIDKGRRSSNPKADYEFLHRTSQTPRQMRARIRQIDDFHRNSLRFWNSRDY